METSDPEQNQKTRKTGGLDKILSGEELTISILTVTRVKLVVFITNPFFLSFAFTDLAFMSLCFGYYLRGKNANMVFHTDFPKKL